MDNNLIAILKLVRKLPRPCYFPVSQKKGLKLVNLVENKFIKGDFVQKLPNKEILKRQKQLFKAFTSLKIGVDENILFAIVLYIWTGCLSMSKLTRKTYVASDGEREYTLGMRKDGYRDLKQLWQEEDKGNGWIKFGITLARGLEFQRIAQDKSKSKPVEKWIPTNSPYWDWDR